MTKLFPLPLFLLPGGRAKLRIFEPRYLRLVRECTANGEGFVLAMMQGQRLYKYGTLVDIVDFETLPDGLLGITIAGRQRVEIMSTEQAPDKLWLGDIRTLHDWPHDDYVDNTDDEVQARIATSLKHVFAAHPDHAEQYEQPHFEDVTWACQRWLEILPLTSAQKQWFIAQDSADEAKQFIHQLLEEHVE
ncbi:LON peptidase substrate-binding domain-containing protein [Salinivibrio sp. PR919]|uniref:LON peptidase substrate-binding domain-containing protein n=1 Tax=Salinivibrio sp. PR919 TaxID=1909491 RepID=UPI00098717FC|nr:LON peptidase substrate-binding domain-containing protein [Salinivibrio sp. PR919]OOF14479.1 ATP-dependent protease [Salinivibrio sp. PR919]